MQSGNNKISVIVPCYNSEATIERCLSSVLAQTVQVYEILVYDDASQDRSSEILAKMASENERISVHTGLKNKGAGYARNALLKKAKGNVFAFLDSDDVWHPRKLELQIDLMNRQGADIVVCYYDVIHVSGEKVGTRRPSASINNFKMHLRNEIPTSMAIVRNELLGCRDMPSIRRRQDYAYWLKIFSQNRELTCMTVPEVLGSYYRTPGSLSSNMVTNLGANFRMFRKIMGYSIALASACVLGNVITRLFRT